MRLENWIDDVKPEFKYISKQTVYFDQIWKFTSSEKKN